MAAQRRIARFAAKLVALVVLLVTIVFAAGASPNTDSVKVQGKIGDGLFTSDAIEGSLDSIMDPTVIRARLVNVDFAAMRAGGSFSNRLVLNLFADTNLDAVLDRVQSNPTGGYTWVGHLEGVEPSLVLLVVNDGVMVAKVSTGREIFQVRYTGSGDLHAVVQIDPAAFPNEGAPTPWPEGLETVVAPVAAVAPNAASDGSVIDLLVVYTADARSAAGGTTAMENEIILAVAEGNVAYAYSGVNQRLALVHMAEVAYTESGSDSTSLSDLRYHGGSYTALDTVTHPQTGLRAIYHADHVALVTQSGGCGLGGLQSTVTTCFAPTGPFHVATRNCLTGNITLPHELGHNMGLRHDWYDDNATTPYSYAHGYLNKTDKWRTIMAYNDECGSSNPCTRLWFFSNPANTLDSDPMGVASGTHITCSTGVSYSPDPNTGDCDADSRQVLNSTAATCDQFSDSENLWTGLSSTAWGTTGNWEMDLGGEGFERRSSSAGFPPPDWSTYRTGDTSGTGWYLSSSSPHGCTYLARHNRHDFATADAIDWIVTPQFTVPSTGGSLTFWERNLNVPGWYDRHSVMIAVSPASCDPAVGPFSELAHYGTAASSWTQRTLSLSAYAGQSVCLAFRYKGTTNENEHAYWYIDDIAISGLTTAQHAPRTMDDVRVPTSPAGGSVWPLISSGTAEAREVLVKTGAQLNMSGGTFNVYGDWEEQGTGVFNGTGGTVAFWGSLDQTITMNSSSDLNNLQVGNGSTSQVVSANSNLDVNGNVVIQSGASLAGGANTIRVAGNWSDTGPAFIPDTSTVICDGSTQTFDRTGTSTTLLDEPFDDADGASGWSAGYLPPGWRPQHSLGSGIMAGDGNYCADGSAMKWNDTADAWLFSTPVLLRPGVTYQVSYRYRSLSGVSTQWRVYVGSDQSASSMSQQVSSVTSSVNSCNSQSDTFTVSSTGTYFIGFRITDNGTGYAILDDIKLTADQDDYLFYNLTIESGTTTFQDDLAVGNNVSIASGAMLDTDSNKISSVGGTFTNNGTMANNETRSVTTGSQTFLDARSNNAAQVTYNSGNQPGDTTVTTRIGTNFPANAFGESCPQFGMDIERYYHITATTGSGLDVTVRFYYNDAELDGNSEAALKIWHCESGTWAEETGTYTRDTTNNWVQVTGVDSFSGFAISGNDPTGVSLMRFEASVASGAIRLAWETSRERNNAGFNLYRSTTAEALGMQLNEALIPSKVPGGDGGAVYDCLDGTALPGVAYYYTLEDVDLSGNRTAHGPAAITLWRSYLPLISR